MTYCVQEPFLAIRNEQSRPFVFVTITEGSIIRVKGEVLQSGLVDVLYEGQIVAAFMRDIEARGLLVEAGLSVPAR
jgi:hypothetical protein